MSYKKGISRSYEGELSKDEHFLPLFSNLQEKYGESKIKNLDGNSSGIKEYVISHPKLKKLLEIVVDHFSKTTSTRIMIFSQYRDSVIEITEILRKQEPLVKPMSFIGQSSSAGGVHGFSQKQQIKVINDFKIGGYNTLISTCIGEEGLDIGEVDLIICYDAQKSPIRMIQRMGRTGRKREGKVIILLTEGKEEQDYKQCLYKRKSVMSRLCSEKELKAYLYQKTARMLPADINPMCVKLQMKGREWKSKENLKKENMGSCILKSRRDKTILSVLTEEQIIWYQKNLKITDGDVLTFRRPALVCKDKGDFSKTTTALDLGNFQPWQTTLQGCVSIMHSKKSQNLVDITQFIGVQSLIDKDSYWEDLKPYFNEDYFREQEDKSTEKEILQKKKRRKPSKNCEIKRLKMDISSTEPVTDIAIMFSDIKRKTDFDIIPLSDNDDIILIDNTRLSVAGQLPVETSNFGLQNVRYEMLFNSSVPTGEPIAFDDPPFYMAELVPCNQIEMKEIYHNLTLTLKSNVIKTRNGIFPTEQQPRSLHRPNNLFSPPSNIIIDSFYSDDNKEFLLHNTSKIADFDLIKSPILSSSYRSRNKTNMTSTPKQILVQHPVISITPINSKYREKTNLCTMYGKRTNNIRQSEKCHSLDDLSPNSIKNVVDFEVLDDVNPINNGESVNQNLMDDVNSNNNKESVNFDLVDNTFFNDFDLTSVEKQDRNKINDDLFSQNVKASTLINNSQISFPELIQTNYVKKSITSNANYHNSNTSDLLKSFDQKKLISKKSKHKDVRQNDSNFMSITQVIDIINEPKTILNFSPKRATNENNKQSLSNFDLSPLSIILKEKNRNCKANQTFHCPDLSPIKDLSKTFSKSNVNGGCANKEIISCNETNDKKITVISKNPTSPFTSPNKKDIHSKHKLENLKANHNIENTIEGINISQFKNENLTIENQISRISNVNKSHPVEKSFHKIESKLSMKKKLFQLDINQNGNVKKVCASGEIPYNISQIREDMKGSAFINIASHSRKNNLNNMSELNYEDITNELCDLKEQPFYNDNVNEAIYNTTSTLLNKKPTSSLLTREKNISFIMNSKDPCGVKESAIKYNDSDLETSVVIDIDSENDFESQLIEDLKKQRNVDNKLIIPSPLNLKKDNEYTCSPHLFPKNSANHFSGKERINKNFELDSSINSNMSDSFNSSNNDPIYFKKKSNFVIFSDSDSDIDLGIHSRKSLKNVSEKEDNCVKSRKKRKSPVKKTVNFIDFEAEVSDRGNSSDESESDLDCYDGSFIDDQGRPTQDAKTDMQAVYLRSVRSPVIKSMHVGKTPKLMKSIKSQENESFDEDDDSFVVDNDFIEYETQFMGNTMLAEDPIINQAIGNKCKENRKRKRIIKYISSEEENSPKKILGNVSLDYAKKSNVFNSRMIQTDAKQPITEPEMNLPTSNAIINNSQLSNQKTNLNLSSSTKGISYSEKECILIDTTEINMAGLIASSLRLKCRVKTYIMPINPASYVLSNRVGVYRLRYSVFAKSSNRDQIVERVKGLIMLYERPTIIVEKDNSLDILNIQRSGYVDTITCALTQLPQVKVLYSNNQEETCATLEHLLNIENIKGFSLPNVNLCDEKIDKVFKFYASIGKLPAASAITLISKYPKLCHLIWSIPTFSEKEESRIPRDHRNIVISHFRRHFNKDLLSLSFKI